MITMIISRTPEGKQYAKSIILIIEKDVGRVSQERIRTKYPALYEYKQSHTSEKTAKASGISIRTVFYINSIFKNKNNTQRTKS